MRRAGADPEPQYALMTFDAIIELSSFVVVVAINAARQIIKIW